MEKNLDLRIQKTYMALTEALWSMMCEMPFENIRVQDLCDRAMIRKSTFYKHFADKYELLAFVVREKIEQFNAQLPPSGSQESPVTYYFHCVDCLFGFLSSNEQLISRSVKSNSLMLVLDELSRQILPDLQHHLAEDEKNGYKLPASPAVMAGFFAGAVSEVTRRWLISGKKMEEAELQEQLKTLINAVYRAENEAFLCSTERQGE